MVGDAIEMEIGPGVEDRSAQRDADRTAKIAHHVKEAAGVFEALRRQAAKAQSHRWGYCEDLREPAQYLRQQKLVAAPIMGNEAKAPHREAEQGKTQHHQPTRVEFARQDDVDGHSDERGGTGREDRYPGLPGAEPAHIAEK